MFKYLHIIYICKNKNTKVSFNLICINTLTNNPKSSKINRYKK